MMYQAHIYRKDRCAYRDLDSIFRNVIQPFMNRKLRFHTGASAKFYGNAYTHVKKDN